MATHTMKAVQVKLPGNVEDLYIDESIAKPSPTEHHVIIKVYATAINRADTLQVTSSEKIRLFYS
jgi:tumor protein p53-inducible protein 3